MEKQKQKAARRAERSQREKPQASGDVDPDIAHIVPGPQPLAEWQVDEEEAASDEENENDDTNQ